MNDVTERPAAPAACQGRVIADELAELRVLLLKSAFGLTRNTADADDLVHDTLQRALTARHRLRSGSSLNAWTRTIMRNLFIDERRRAHHRAPMRPEFEPVAPETTPLGPLDVFDAGDVLSALSRLPVASQSLFRFAYIEGASYRELSHRLSIPIETVGTRLLRIRRRLRTILLQGHSRRERLSA